MWWRHRRGRDNEESSDLNASAGSDSDADSALETPEDHTDYCITHAFLASLDSTPNVAQPDCPSDYWGEPEVLAWLNTAVDKALACASRTESAKAIWTEWMAIETNVAPHSRRQTIRTMDAYFHSRGFPSLRDLVGDDCRSDSPTASGENTGPT